MAEGHQNAHLDGPPTYPYDPEAPCPLPMQRSNRAVQESENKQVCRYFMEGRCRYGTGCWNSHDLNDAAVYTLQISRLPFINRPAQRSVIRDLSREPPGLSRSTDPCGAAAAGHSNWVLAPEFVPQAPRSYADTARSGLPIDMQQQQPDFSYIEMCSLHIDGECPFQFDCPYVHGEHCDTCGKNCLHPYNRKQSREHRMNCEAELLRDMELSFAVQRSQDKTCGICMDVIMEKVPPSERRFGILEKCNHVFCLACIRKWRNVKHLEAGQIMDSGPDATVTRACPECRVSSDFVTPSQFWVDTQEEKTKLIHDYKEALSKKPCKYFKQGKGTCPFGGACFYLHAKPDGTKVELPLPVRRRRQNQDGDYDLVDSILLWDYLGSRSNVWLQLELEDFRFSELSSDESDDSDNLLLSEPF